LERVGGPIRPALNDKEIFVPTGFKRLSYVLVAVMATGVALLVAMSFLIPPDQVREAVKAELRAVTGLEPALRGDTTISLFPSGRVQVEDVVLGDTRSGLTPIAVERLNARLRFFPLLTGKIEIAEVALIRPNIEIMLEAGGRSNWSGLIETLAGALAPSAARSFSEIRVSDGTVVLRNAPRSVDETLTHVDLSLAWPSISRSFAATGRFKWRGETIDGSIQLNDFLAALSGERSGLKVRLAGSPLKVAFDGQMSYRPRLKIEGTLAADAPSLREAVRWVALRPVPDGGFGRFALKAQTTIQAGSFALSGVNVELDGNSAEGVLTFVTDGRQTLQGTLAAESLNLTPYVSAIRLLAGSERGWNGGTLSLEGLTGFDLDLRLSAARVLIATAKLGRTAVVANLRSGNLMLTVGESQAFGGVIKGSLGLAKIPNGAELKTQMQFADVDLENCLGEIFGLRKLEGKGNMSLVLDSVGASVLALTRGLNGTANLTARQGSLAGVNVEQLLRRLERRPLSGGGEFRSGRTPFDRLAINLKIAEGNALVEDVRIEGPAIRLALGGSTSIPARELDLKGTASLVSSTSEALFELPFVIGGTWDDPVLLPDPQILMRRSGAAQPLLQRFLEQRRAPAGPGAPPEAAAKPRE
jgi:AsmA protein